MKKILSLKGTLSLTTVAAALLLALCPAPARAQAPTPSPAPGSAPVAEPARPAAASHAAPAEGTAAEEMAEHEHHHEAGAEGDSKLGGDSPRFKQVRLTITSPKEGQVVPAGKVQVSFRLTGYKTPGAAPAAGAMAPHIHVIVDNTAYKPDFDASKPFDIGELAEGPHTIRAFPSRPWHESLKSCAPGCFKSVRFWVGKKGVKPGWFDPKKPLLTYSRPKGDYAGADAKRIMVDFYLINARLSPKGDKVQFHLDAQEQDPFTEWKPRWLENLAPGEHTVKLSLVNAKNEPIENGDVNVTERKFTVK